MRPNRKQWATLWLGTFWVLLVLALAEDYVARGVFAGVLVTALLFWQLATRQSQPSQHVTAPESRNTAADTQPGPSDPLPPDDTQTGPVGVDGWLAFFCVGLVLTPIWLALRIGTDAKDASTPFEAFVVLALEGLLASGAVYILLGIQKRWQTAPRNAVRFLLFVLGLSLVAMAGGIADATNAEEVGRQIGSVFGSVVYALVWSAYFRKSKRVRATFSSPEAVLERSIPRFSAALVGIGVMLIGAVQYSGHQQDLAAFDKLTPYHFVKFGRTVGAAEFDEGFTRSVTTRFEKTLPAGSSVKFDGNARFMDLGSAIRAVLTYRGLLKMDDGTSETMNGAVQQYFHATGIATLEGICLDDRGACGEMINRLAAAENLLLVRLDGPELDGLIAGDDCTIASNSDVGLGIPIDTAMCSYGPSSALVLTLAKLSLSQASEQLRLSYAALDPQVKIAVVRASRR